MRAVGGNGISISKKYRPGPIVVERKLIGSRAFLALTGASPQVLLIFYSKRQMQKLSKRNRKDDWMIVNNGEIMFPYSEAENKYGLKKDRFTRALDQLIEVGFIEIAQCGGGLFGEPTKYSISDRWKSYGKMDFKEATRRKRLYQMGFCGKKQKQRSKPRVAQRERKRVTSTF